MKNKTEIKHNGVTSPIKPTQIDDVPEVSHDSKSIDE
jgi:hypothetical protein